MLTNYHAFKRRERMALSKGSRCPLQGRAAAPFDTTVENGRGHFR